MRVSPLIIVTIALGMVLHVADQTAIAQTRFLTLPYDDPQVAVGEGWVYETDGPFYCTGCPCTICPVDPGQRCHKGIDFSKHVSGQSSSVTFDVLAAAGGHAVWVSDKDYGKFVYVVHDEKDQLGRRYFTLYGHLASSDPSIPKKTKEQLKADIQTEDFSDWAATTRGRNIGKAGNTGLSFGIHLHFEVHRGGFALNKVDPFDICGTMSSYPNPCGAGSLWIQCFPVVSSCPGNALQFDGVNDEVDIPSSPNLSFGAGGQMTVELWFNLSQPRSPVYHLIGKRVGCGDYNYQLAVGSGELHFSTGSTPAFRVGTPFTAPVGQWVHVAATCDGSIVRLYVNGELMATGSGSLGNVNNEPLRIGQSGTCQDDFRFVGLIDEVRIWNVARLQSEIAANFTRTVDPNSPGLVGYWNFDEASDAPAAIDRSGHGNDGTLINGVPRVTSTAPICGAKFFATTGHYYQLVKGLQSTCWTDANQVATAAGGYLASVRSVEENQFILDLMPSDASAYSGIFIGGEAPDGQGADPSKYSWTSGEPWTYSRWSPGEPNYPQESKLEIFYDVPRRGYWNNSENCITGWDIYFVVEYDSDPVASAGPRRFFAGTGHWYQVVYPQQPMSWTMARDAAFASGGYLVSILGQAENDFVQALLPGAPYNGTWIGGFELNGVENDWHWVSGEPWGYTNWNLGTGEPNNGWGNAEEDATNMWGPGSGYPPGKWNDAQTSNLDPAYVFVVEYDAPPSPKVLAQASDTTSPPELNLDANYPNPFNAATSIRFDLSAPGRVSLDIFNVLGQKVATLLDENLQAGSHILTWDGRDSRGESVSSGLYFYRLTTSKQSITKKMVLLK